MNEYRALIVDDEQGNRELLSKLLLDHCPQIQHITTANSVNQALKEIQQANFDVVFLDIEMPGGNGFQLLNRLPSFDFKVIFVTAFDSYALKAIKYSALDYLLKPIITAELIEAVNKLDLLHRQDEKLKLLKENLSHSDRNKVALSTQDEVVFVELDEIIHLEAEANYTRIYLKGQDSLLLSGNLGTFEKLLSDSRFFRSHQSHLINVHSLKKFIKKDGGYFLMENDAEIPLARLKREEWKNRFIGS